MPAPMDKANFAERVEQLGHAAGLQKFQEPPAQQPAIEMPDAESVWRLLQCVEQMNRTLRGLTVE